MMRFAATLVLAASLFGQARRVTVISHRGEHEVNPENTIPGFRTAFELGADMVEVDIRTTSDGKLVLMHDRSVDRTTNAHGEIAKMTLAEVRALDAGIKKGKQFENTQVPTFDEALDLVGPQAGVYLDCKDVSPELLIAAVERHGLIDRVVIYGGPAFLKKVMALQPRLKAMPEAVNPSVLQKLIDSLKLRVAAFNDSDWNEPTIAVAREAKIDLFVDRLGAADQPEAWQQAIDVGATGIQTDKPGELIRYLKEKGYR